MQFFVMQVKSYWAQIQNIIGLAIGSGTTALSIDSIIKESTPVLQYLGLCFGVLLTFVYLIKAVLPNKKSKKK